MENTKINAPLSDSSPILFRVKFARISSPTTIVIIADIRNAWVYFGVSYIRAIITGSSRNIPSIMQIVPVKYAIVLSSLGFILFMKNEFIFYYTSY